MCEKSWDDYLKEEPINKLPNNLKIAERIFEIENANYKTQKEWLKENRKEWDLGDGITLRMSDDCMTWHLFVNVTYKANRCYWKCVPMAYLSKKVLAKILAATPWIYL